MSSVRLLILHKPGERRAQLDLLLRSLGRNWPDADPLVIDTESGVDFHRKVFYEMQWGTHPFTAFACDDGIVYRPISADMYTTALADHEVICWSARLGANTDRCDPLGRPQRVPGAVLSGEPWRWWDEDADFRYPGSVDAHVFRTDLLNQLLWPQAAFYPNPTALECGLQDACMGVSPIYPLMACPPLSCYVGVPVNRVSSQSGVVHGRVYPQTGPQLEERYACGHRIDLDRIDPAEIDAAHTELLFQWS